MNIGFHTISMLLHDEVSAVGQLAKIGFRTVALRPRLGGLDPSESNFNERMLRFTDAARRLNLQVVYDLDANYLHDPGVKLGPSLASCDAKTGSDARAWVQRWIQIASEHQCSLITFASGQHSAATDHSAQPQPLSLARDSGKIDQTTDEDQLDALAGRLNELIHQATDVSVRLAIRPSCGHVISSIAQYERLRQWLSASGELYLATDIADMVDAQEIPLGARLSQCGDQLACVYMKQPRVGESELMGRVDLHQVVKSLQKWKFDGHVIFNPPGDDSDVLATAKLAHDQARTP